MIAATLAFAASATAADLHYVERLTGGATAQEVLPLVVAIHGLGDRPDDFASLFEGFSGRARFVFPRAPKVWGPGYSWFDVQGGSNSDPDRYASEIANAASLVADLIAELSAEHPTRGRAIVTGFSQGGMLSYALAALHREHVAVAVPVSGLLPAAVELTAAVPILPARVVALHGVRDTRVAFEAARSSVERLRDVGYDASLKGYTEVGHTVSPAMRRDLFEALAAAFEPALPNASVGNGHTGTVEAAP